MNKTFKDILLACNTIDSPTQRSIADFTHYSLGTVNKIVKELHSFQYIDNRNNLTELGKKQLLVCKPKNAIILAAGFGKRMVPINNSLPKGLLSINNEVIIERIIKQLHEAGVDSITIVTGYMKEKFEYLIDEYNVELVYNENYPYKNNLYSLALAASKIGNTYIIPSDIWCEENPFNPYEVQSWYMLTEEKSSKSTVTYNDKSDIRLINNDEIGNKMIGIAYIDSKDALALTELLNNAKDSPFYNQSFWEDVWFSSKNLSVKARVVSNADNIEIDTYEQLRELDHKSESLQSSVISLISNIFNVKNSDIKNIRVLKKGMTNRSFLFAVNNISYIMRIPGEGTDQLINRKEEAAVYQIIADYNLSDPVIYINPDNGYKISKFFPNSRSCDSNNKEDLAACMKYLKEFHNLKLKVDHFFDIFEKIQFYEDLWQGQPSIFKDYQSTKEKVYSLKEFIDSFDIEYSLTHIDAVPDNFIFTENNEIHLIDWEYSSNQDPHLDIAMFCIYSIFDEEQVDDLINMYFENNADERTKYKIYAYIATAGLLWSNWCEYKRLLGVEFGEYSLVQYRYAKNYSKKVISYLNRSASDN